MKHHVCEEDYIWNPSTCFCENGEYLKSIIDDLAAKCDKIIEPKKTIPINFNDKKATCKIDNFSVLSTFLLITILLLLLQYRTPIKTKTYRTTIAIKG